MSSRSTRVRPSPIALTVGLLVLLMSVALTALAAPAGVLFLAVVAVSALPLRD